MAVNRQNRRAHIFVSVLAKDDNCVSRKEVIALVLSSKILNSTYKLMGK